MGAFPEKSRLGNLGPWALSDWRRLKTKQMQRVELNEKGEIITGGSLGAIRRSGEIKIQIYGYLREEGALGQASYRF